MKTILLFCILFLICLHPLLAQTSMATTDDLAKRIVNSVANVKPGDVVIIEGGKNQIELMEAIGEQIHKKGAYPTLSLTTERVVKAYLASVPEAHFSAHHSAEHKAISKMDLMIKISDDIDYPALNKQVPKEHADKHNKLMEEEHNSGNLSIVTC
jgi:leucyl aminopeptidase (aminopeptidase T)